jgi:predicted glycoside hydrolase/deacetylase ChbG (UPF0249 family)
MPIMKKRFTPIVLIVWIQLASALAGAQDRESEIRLLVRSDDMGVAHAVNQACLESVTKGIARSIEVIVPGPWFLEAVQMLKANPDIDVGVHLDLTSEWSDLKWGPVSKDVPSLVDENGHFYPTTQQRPGWPKNTGFLVSDWKIEEVERELRAQIEMALRLFPNVTHLSTHMGTASGTPELAALTNRLAKEYKLPVQLPDAKWGGGFGSKSDSFEDRVSAMIELIERLGPGLWILVEHPGMDTPEMRAIGNQGYNNVAEDRTNVTHVFTNNRVREAIRKRGIKLVSYADVLGR